MKTGAFRNITVSCFLSTLHSFLESQSSQHIAKATFSKTWWSLSKMKPSSSSYMTKMVRAQARMCCRTYRGRWPSGFSQSTCHLPKALLYETSSPGVFPGTCQFGCYVGFPWTYTSHLASVFGWAKELPQLPQLLLTKQMQLPWAPVEKERTCHWPTDQSAPGSRGRRPMGQPRWPHLKAPQGSWTPLAKDLCLVGGLRPKGHSGSRWTVGELHRRTLNSIIFITH